LENAITSSGVLGKEQPQAPAEEEDRGACILLFLSFAIYLTFLQADSVNGPVLSFSGDGEEEDPAVDLFANAEKAVSEEEEAPGQADDDNDDDEEEGEDEPEDDFNAAWEVLDLARAIYDREIQQEEDDEVKLKLADTYIALGDISLETGTLFFENSTSIVE